MRIRILFTLVLLLGGAHFATAQSTEFTFQGRLVDGALPANASYDLEFKLYDVETGGTVIGTQTRLGVVVSNGSFTVRLDFGAAGFRASPRFLEIFVKSADGPTFTALTPRQPVTSTPHAIKSLSADTAQSAFFANTATDATNAANAAQLGGIAANQYVVTTDPRMTDARNPLPGSQSYIHNSGVVQGGDFNIDGDGVADVFSARSQFNIGNNRVVSIAGIANTFVGLNAGTASTGNSNSFFGNAAGGGLANSGNANSFFGERAGALNTTGAGNSFVGSAAGVNNTSGTANAFFGLTSGQSNTTGGDNSFFGAQAGFSNTIGINNAFFGRAAGVLNTASDNSFFGFRSGESNTAGTRNAFFGTQAGRAVTTGDDNAFFGYRAGFVNTADGNSFFGSQAGDANTTGSFNSFFGFNAGTATAASTGNSFFGWQAGAANVGGGGNSFFGKSAGESNTAGANSFFGWGAGSNTTSGPHNTFVGYNAGSTNTTGSNNTYVGTEARGTGPVGGVLTFATAIGAGSVVSQSDTVVIGRAADTVRVPGSFNSTGAIITSASVSATGNVFVGGLLSLDTLGAAGSTDVCRNAMGFLSTCSSSLRYKTDVQPFFGGLSVVRSLSPITFNWKDGGKSDVGFAAEEVEKIEPLLTTYNDRGEIEGVKYAQITTVLVNAVNEQQQIIERQQRQIDALKRQQLVIGELRQIVCTIKPDAAVCKETNK